MLSSNSNLYRYRKGLIKTADLRQALRRLNVDPTDAAFTAFAAKYDPARTGLIEYGPLSKALVPVRGSQDAMVGGCVQVEYSSPIA